MQTSTQVKDIQGIAAEAWGNVFIPGSNGTITLSVKGDVLEARVKKGMSTQTTWTRIQTINSIEISHSPVIALIGLGIFIVLTGLTTLSGSISLGLIILIIGIVITVYAWTHKRRLLVVYATSSTIPIFMNKPTEIYENFAMSTLAISRQLNRLPQPAQRQLEKRS